MFGRKKKPEPKVIDITKKRVKTWYGGEKLVPTTKVEQKRMKALLQKWYPDRLIIDDSMKKQMELDWIDCIEEIDALFGE